jgi:hypothetical protein
MSLPGRLCEKPRPTSAIPGNSSTRPAEPPHSWTCQVATAAINSANRTILRTRLRL